MEDAVPPSDQPSVTLLEAAGADCDPMLCEEPLADLIVASLATGSAQQYATPDRTAHSKRQTGKPLAAGSAVHLQQHLQSKRVKGPASSDRAASPTPGSSSRNSDLQPDLSTLLRAPNSAQHTSHLQEGVLLDSSSKLRRFKLATDLPCKLGAPLPSTPLPSPAAAAAADADERLEDAPGSVLKGTPAPLPLRNPNRPTRMQPRGEGDTHPPLWSPYQQDRDSCAQPPLPPPAAGSGPPGDPVSGSSGRPLKHQRQQAVAPSGSPCKNGLLQTSSWMQSVYHTLQDMNKGSPPPGVPPNSPCSVASPAAGAAATAAPGAGAGTLFYDHLLAGAGSPSVPVAFNHAADEHMAIDSPPAASGAAPLDQGGRPLESGEAAPAGKGQQGGRPPDPGEAAPAGKGQQEEEAAGHRELSKPLSDVASGAAAKPAGAQADGGSVPAAAAPPGSHQQTTGSRALSSPASRQLRFDVPNSSPAAGGLGSPQQSKQPSSPAGLTSPQQLERQQPLQANLTPGKQPQKQQQRKEGWKGGIAGALSRSGNRSPGAPLQHGVFGMFLMGPKAKKQQQQQQPVPPSKQQQQSVSPKLPAGSAWSQGPPAALLAAGKALTAAAAAAAAPTASTASTTRPVVQAGPCMSPAAAAAATAAAAPRGVWAGGSAAVRGAPATAGGFRSSMRVVIQDPTGEPDAAPGAVSSPGAARASPSAPPQQRQKQKPGCSAVHMEEAVAPPTSPHSGWAPVPPAGWGGAFSQPSPSLPAAAGCSSGTTAAAEAGNGRSEVQLAASDVTPEPYGGSSGAATDSPNSQPVHDDGAPASCSAMDTTTDAPAAAAGAAAAATCSGGGAAPADAAYAAGPSLALAGAGSPAPAAAGPGTAAGPQEAPVDWTPAASPAAVAAAAAAGEQMDTEVTQQDAPGPRLAAWPMDAAAALGLQAAAPADIPSLPCAPLQLPPALRAAAAAARQVRRGPPPGFEAAAGQGWGSSSLCSSPRLVGSPPGLPTPTADGPGPTSCGGVQLGAGGAAEAGAAAAAGGVACGASGSWPAAGVAEEDRMDTEQLGPAFEYPPVDAAGPTGWLTRSGSAAAAARRRVCGGGAADSLGEEEEDDVPPGFPGAPCSTAAAVAAGQWVRTGDRSSSGGGGNNLAMQPPADALMTEAAEDLHGPGFLDSPLIIADLQEDLQAHELMDMDLDMGGGEGNQGGGGLPQGEVSWCSYSSDGGGGTTVPLAPGAAALLGPGLDLDPAQLLVEESYTGPRMEVGADGALVVTEGFVVATVGAFRTKQLLHARYAWEILRQAHELQAQRPTLVDVTLAPTDTLRVCGDVHGQFFDLLTIFQRHGNPSPSNPYLFNGDLVDRGSYSAEVVFTLFAWQLLHPSCMYINRGNHEARSLNCRYGFSAEMKAKYGKRLLRQCQAVFNLLPLATCINASVLVVHGGLPGQDGVTLDDIRAINRNREPEGGSSIMYDLLWSDPKDEAGKEGSMRGAGVLWGPDYTERFLRDNGLSLIVRSHQHKERGWEQHHNGKVLTVFSAPNYCGCVGNLGAVLKIDGRCMTELCTFEEVEGVEQLPCNYYYSEDDMHEEMEEHRAEGDRWSSGDAGTDLVEGVVLDPDVTEYDFEYDPTYTPW